LLGSSCDGSDSDLCEEGTNSCTGGILTCSDTSGDDLDVCNGSDDDCDSASVDGSEDPSLGLACEGTDSDLCEEGTNLCTDGALECSDTSGDNPEICNGSDDDCDGSIDEGFPLFTYYEDLDEDTYGNATATTETCLGSPPSPYVADSTDCDDSEGDINPSDTDSDNYSTCDEPPDCDDSDAALNLDDPGIGETVGDGYSTCTGDTEAGTDVEVYADDPTSPLDVEVNFATISTSGLTSVAMTTTAPAVPSGWQAGTPPLFFDLTTTASYAGTIVVCVEYDESSFVDESEARIYHYDDPDWVDVTLPGYPDTVDNIICGQVAHLSMFAALESTPSTSSGGGGGGGCNLSGPDQESGFGSEALLLLLPFGFYLSRRRRRR
jgi:MYXO-CTERM domain-containing protein